MEKDIISKNEAQKNKSKMIDCLILDSPFANFRGMIHDVIHSQYKVCGCCINMALSGVLKDCKKKINKDLTLIKPLEAVPFIDIPVFYMVGKQDIIARPEKVKELFLKTKSDLKEYHSFEGEHPSHRDKYILKKAILFILNEFDSLTLNSVSSTIKDPVFNNKKEKNIFNKNLLQEHKTELFIDPPVKIAKQPKKIPEPKMYDEDVEKDLLNLSGEKMKNDNNKFVPIPSPIMENPVKSSNSIKPNQGIDAISNNLNKPNKNIDDISKNLDKPDQGIDAISNNLDKKIEKIPEKKIEDLPKEGLNLSFSEKAPPLQNKAEEIIPSNLNKPSSIDLKPELPKSPSVTGNSSPK